MGDMSITKGFANELERSEKINNALKDFSPRVQKVVKGIIEKYDAAVASNRAISYKEKGGKDILDELQEDDKKDITNAIYAIRHIEIISYQDRIYIQAAIDRRIKKNVDGANASHASSQNFPSQISVESSETDAPKLQCRWKHDQKRTLANALQNFTQEEKKTFTSLWAYACGVSFSGRESLLGAGVRVVAWMKGESTCEFGSVNAESIPFDVNTILNCKMTNSHIKRLQTALQSLIDSFDQQTGNSRKAGDITKHLYEEEMNASEINIYQFEYKCGSGQEHSRLAGLQRSTNEQKDALRTLAREANCTNADFKAAKEQIFAGLNGQTSTEDGQLVNNQSFDNAIKFMIEYQKSTGVKTNRFIKAIKVFNDSYTTWSNSTSLSTNSMTVLEVKAQNFVKKVLQSAQLQEELGSILNVPSVSHQAQIVIPNPFSTEFGGKTSNQFVVPGAYLKDQSANALPDDDQMIILEQVDESSEASVSEVTLDFSRISFKDVKTEDIENAKHQYEGDLNESEGYRQLIKSIIDKGQFNGKTVEEVWKQLPEDDAEICAAIVQAAMMRNLNEIAQELAKNSSSGKKLTDDDYRAALHTKPITKAIIDQIGNDQSALVEPMLQQLKKYYEYYKVEQAQKIVTLHSSESAAGTGEIDISQFRYSWKAGQEHSELAGLQRFTNEQKDTLLTLAREAKCANQDFWAAREQFFAVLKGNSLTCDRESIDNQSIKKAIEVIMKYKGNSNKTRLFVNVIKYYNNSYVDWSNPTRQA